MEEQIALSLTPDEAWELLSRCLNSLEQDNDVSRTALKKLAAAIQANRPTVLKNAS